MAAWIFSYVRNHKILESNQRFQRQQHKIKEDDFSWKVSSFLQVANDQKSKRRENNFPYKVRKIDSKRSLNSIEFLNNKTERSSNQHSTKSKSFFKCS